MATMDSPTLYGFETDEKAHKPAEPAFSFIDDQLSTLSDLDPNSELSFDLNQLIEGNQNEILFPELLSPSVTGPDTSESNNVVDPVILTPETAQGASCMPEVVTIDIPTDEAGIPLFTAVKAEATEQAGSVITLDSQLAASVVGDLSLVPITIVPSTPADNPPKRTVGRPRATGKATAPSKSAVKSTSRRKVYEKDTEEYRARRERNNVAVRKSRDKAKIKQVETNSKLKALTDHNEALQKKVDLLSKELNVLKGLFTNVGAALPKEFKEYMQKNQ